MSDYYKLACDDLAAMTVCATRRRLEARVKELEQERDELKKDVKYAEDDCSRVQRSLLASRGEVFGLAKEVATLGENLKRSSDGWIRATADLYKAKQEAAKAAESKPALFQGDPIVTDHFASTRMAGNWTHGMAGAIGNCAQGEEWVNDLDRGQKLPRGALFAAAYYLKLKECRAELSQAQARIALAQSALAPPPPTGESSDPQASSSNGRSSGC